MNNKIKLILSLLLFALFLSGAYAVYSYLSPNYLPTADTLKDINGATAAAAQEDSTTSGDNSTDTASSKIVAPDFTVYGADGSEYRLSDFRGKPVVINFWASWCPPCREEMPNFDEVYKNYKDEVVFLMVDLVDGRRETQESGQSYVEKEGYTFPIYFDLNTQVASIYGISSIPTTLFIDQEGYLYRGYIGPLSQDTIEGNLQALLD